MKRYLLVAVVVGGAALLVACGGGGGGGSGGGNAIAVQPLTPDQQIAADEAAGRLPKLDRSTSVTGTDANANGIRDDVDTWISGQTSFTPPQKASAVQLAKAIQLTLSTSVSDQTAKTVAALAITRAVNCAGTTFSTSNSIVYDLESITTNTKQRLAAYIAFNQSLDGGVFSLPREDTCE